MIGIYAIVSLIDSRLYIGKSVDIKSRFRHHKNDLIKNKHDNLHLQRFVNRYGISNLDFQVLCECSKNELSILEKTFVRLFNSKNQGFNQTEGGEDNKHFEKPYRLKNIITGEIEEGIGIKSFAKKYGFSKNGVSEVVNGNRRFIFNWYNPDKWEPKRYILISPDGKEYEIIEGKIAYFCKKYNLNPSQISRLLNGKNESVLGWRRPNSILNKENLRSCKTFQVLSPDGKYFTGINRSEFCRRHNLSQPCFNKMILTKTAYRGWKTI
jgi:predicted GIY-YIG superfamily endonuclease